MRAGVPATMGVLWSVLFVTGIAAGVLATAFGLPGTILIAVIVTVVALLTGFAVAPLWLVVPVLVAAVLAELADQWVSAWAVKRYEGTTRGMVGALVVGFAGAVAGGFLGTGLAALGFLLSPFLSAALLVLGPFLGGSIGGFVGAFAAELTQRPAGEAARAGWGALLGRALGTLLKVAMSVALAAASIAVVVPRLLGR